MPLRDHADPVPTHSNLVNLLMARRRSTENPDTDRGWVWNANPGPEDPIETLTTSEIEYYLLLDGRRNLLGSNPLFARRSRVVVKNPNDTFYSSAGYPNPPMGGIFRGIGQDGALGAGNFLEITPAYFIVKNALSVSDNDLAEKVTSFVEWMTFDANFYGSTIKLVAGVARYEQGAWRRRDDTVLIRNMANAALCHYEMFTSNYNEAHRTKARELLKTIALVMNVNKRRANDGEIPSWMAGAIPHAFVKLPNGNYALTWTRWTIEHLAMIALLLEKAISVEGQNYQVQDWQGNTISLSQMGSLLGSWVDAFFDKPLLMRDTNPHAAYLPYQFVLNHAGHSDPRSFVGVNFDWTEESGSAYSQSTWWVGDLELWGIWGMLKLKKLGFTQEKVETFLWDWLRLPPGGYLWHDRYDFFCNPLPHDPSVAIAFTALYGICLKEGYNPVAPPPRTSYRVFDGGTIEVTTDKKSIIPVVRLPNGNVLEPTNISPSSTTKGYRYRYTAPTNVYYLMVEEKLVFGLETGGGSGSGG